MKKTTSRGLPMIGDKRFGFKTEYHYNQHQEPQNPTEIEKKQISQSDIMNRIHTEFQKQTIHKKPFIKNLYQKSEWQQRVFWAVVGTLQNAYDDLEVDVSLDRITTAVNQYVKQGGF